MFLNKYNICNIKSKKHGYSMYYRYWRDILFEYACKIFSYTGEIAEKIPAKEIEIMLLTNGKAGFHYLSNGNFVVSYINLYGITDYYNIYSNYNYKTPIESESREIGKDGVLIENNSLRNGILETIHAYACQLAHYDVSIIVDTINERETAAYTAITSQHAQAVRDYRSKVYEGKLDALVDEGFSTVEIRDLMNKSGSSGRIRELIDCKNETLNGFLELIGVKRANTKRERTITDEVGANNSLLKLNIRDMFESRKKGLAEVERVFGISGNVICNVDLEDDGDMTEERGGVENE